MDKVYAERNIEEFRAIHSDGSELGLVEGELIAGLIALQGKVNEMVDWINKQQAGGEHDPGRKSKYIRKVRRNIDK